MQAIGWAQTMPGGNTLFLAVMVAITSWLMLRVFLKRRIDSRFKPPTEGQSAAPLVGAPKDVSRWQVEMHDLARDLSAQMDSKMSALQHLIRQAADESERLERALNEAKQREGR